MTTTAVAKILDESQVTTQQQEDENDISHLSSSGIKEADFDADAKTEMTQYAKDNGFSSLRRSVSFDRVQIREYPMILGHNPAVQIGTPVTLDWEYQELPDVLLEDFERHVVQERPPWIGILNYFQRRNILASKGYSVEEIDYAEQQTNHARWQRTFTIACLPFGNLEESMQSIHRALKHGFCSRHIEEEDRTCAVLDTGVTSLPPPTLLTRQSMETTVLS